MLLIRKIVIWGTVGAFVLGAAAVFLLMLLYWLSYPFDNRQFDRAEWTAGNDFVRGEMADSLRYRYLREGMPEADVIRLIGEGEVVLNKDNHWPDKVSGAYCRSYFVGGWSEGSMDSAWLMLFFDDDKLFVDSRIDGF